MMTREEVVGHWDKLRGQVEKRWRQLGSHDLDKVEGNVDQLIGVLQQKTGQTRGAIEDELEALWDRVAEGGGGVLQATGEYAKEAAEYARNVGEKVSQTARDQYEHVSESVRHGVENAEDMVRHRPAESVAIAFGTGLVTGLVIGLLVMRR